MKADSELLLLGVPSRLLKRMWRFTDVLLFYTVCWSVREITRYL